MIVAQLSDPLLRSVLRAAARSDEDVVGPPLDAVAAAQGFPRLVVRTEEKGVRRGPVLPDRRVPRLVLTRAVLGVGEVGRAKQPDAGARGDATVRRARILVREHAAEVEWVDRVLGDLARASGAPLPGSFRGMARRVLEFPSRYVDLGPLAGLSGVGRDAIRARFRRRGMESPSVWLRWLRVIAVAHLLSDRSVSTHAVAHRLGFSSGGNLCRFVRDVAGITPTEARDPMARARLVSRVAEELSAAGCREGWESLGAVFLEGAA